MEVVDLRIEDLRIHPKNVRKKYDGIDELASSIKEKGMLQNLTVVRDPEEEGKYFVVIGNRRLTAAKKIGIESVPCIIVDEMDEKSQVTTMLTENMNRKDLRVYEEAEAMQMCFEDFGISVEDISKETGLSKTTVNHRLNVAKLDQDELKKKVEDEEFQLTMTDLQSLEKIENTETRNKVLKESQNSRDLSARAIRAAKEELENKHEREFIALCEKRGIEEAPEEAQDQFYSNKWDRIADWRLEDNVPKRLKLDKEKSENRKLFYLKRYGTFYVIAKHEKEKRVLSDWEIEEKKRKKTEREIKAKYKAIWEDMGNFVRSIIDGSTKPVKDTTNIEEGLWQTMLRRNAYLGKSRIAEALLGKDVYAKSVEPEEREKAFEQAEKLSSLHQKIAICYMEMKTLDLADYRLMYKSESADILKTFFGCLQEYGYSWPDEESIRLVEGEHELYIKQEKEEE